MPPQRPPLARISGNRLKNQELSPYQRGKAIGMLNGGLKFCQIQKRMKCSRGALRSTFDIEALRHEGESLPRSGPPLCYTEADERRLIRHVRLHPKDSYSQLILALGLAFRARRRPELTEVNAAERLVWCLKNRHRNAEEWGTYMWSDECFVERGRGKQTEWVFCITN
ncbi:uncharacterized protein LY89DRAFT_790705 [Mollisia scopiformis]|uniref:Transposase n=1 Tax=Mollisia scopiformis TaxID=149040 RepID=A0A132B2Q9_MOLSC|nr:uncharacterized protein LY89DRAFT_790705 [Mollisia scopiformis]KUJ06194.1 hypothetical protein LY89DRAFT_790705 [Mollisia scopiformis]